MTLYQRFMIKRKQQSMPIPESLFTLKLKGLFLHQNYSQLCALVILKVIVFEKSDQACSMLYLPFLN